MTFMKNEFMLKPFHWNILYMTSCTFYTRTCVCRSRCRRTSCSHICRLQSTRCTTCRHEFIKRVCFLWPFSLLTRLSTSLAITICLLLLYYTSYWWDSTLSFYKCSLMIPEKVLDCSNRNHCWIGLCHCLSSLGHAAWTFYIRNMALWCLEIYGSGVCIYVLSCFIHFIHSVFQRGYSV